MKATISAEEIAHFNSVIRKLSNSAQFEKAYKLARKLHAQYPHVLRFAYEEAVFSAEDDTGYSKAEVRKRHRSAAKKLKKLTRRLNGADIYLAFGIRNEYYWFSHQPRKQYLLGVEGVRRGNVRANYSQGVGAVEVAKQYALKGRKTMALRWAKRSEKAWLRFFKHDSKWFNSYFFYAAALAYQGRFEEMDKAFATSAKIASKPVSWKAIRDFRSEVLAIAKRM